MNSFFVGAKSNPSFLVEIITKKKLISIYKPDKFSKNEEFYEKYSLGKLLIDTKYDSIIFLKKPIYYKKHLYTPKIIVKIKNKYICISKTINNNYK